MNEIAIRDLGRIEFDAALREMRLLARAVSDGRNPGEIWLLEHPPVYTAGRATPAAEASAVGAIPIERGGRITYHGPGQLVVYPIVPVPFRDIGEWLRRLERVGAAVCAAFDLTTAPSADGTGVFVDGRKVGSIGIAVRRWVNLHGLAINVDLELAPFFRIRPCGLAPETMTDLSRASGRTVTVARATAAAVDAVRELIQRPTRAKPPSPGARAMPRR
jgi:lipoyl(octanoyl) transferase